MNISILMPCLNEEKTIEECINKAKDYLSKNNLAGEIIVWIILYQKLLI